MFPNSATQDCCTSLHSPGARDQLPRQLHPVLSATYHVSSLSYILPLSAMASATSSATSCPCQLRHDAQAGEVQLVVPDVDDLVGSGAHTRAAVLPTYHEGADLHVAALG
eukprot:CAMPEP_0202893980 /NCGR_PEP_ID=MMETSP1392-20130828/3455_1 /ASSEMBLY_ACC=CAM_ASM_000868 /TAXON_ID=225041 /ORGANISM="Chlamydomonas chlamydogama, Strain SAG 11-48b" /LENGTH=109 /DNA_ID=CAMNT_0049578501 /DNA_START=753 /DNA_END=1078 /DNA_ORIENTATION=-